MNETTRGECEARDGAEGELTVLQVDTAVRDFVQDHGGVARRDATLHSV